MLFIYLFIHLFIYSAPSTQARGLALIVSLRRTALACSLSRCCTRPHFISSTFIIIAGIIIITIILLFFFSSSSVSSSVISSVVTSSSRSKCVSVVDGGCSCGDACRDGKAAVSVRGGFEANEECGELCFILCVGLCVLNVSVMQDSYISNSSKNLRNVMSCVCVCALI